MSNGYLIAVGADVAAAHEISDGFGLDVIDAASIGDPNAAASGLGAAANVGLLVSSASADDAHYVAILRALAQGLQRAQLILVDPDVRGALGFLPEAWPAMSLDDARTRSAELVRLRDAAPSTDPQPAAPIPPAPDAQTSTLEAEPETSPPPQDEGVGAADAPAAEADQQEEHAEPTLSEVTHQPAAESQQADPSSEREELSASAGDAPSHEGNFSRPAVEAPIPAAPPQVQPAPAHPPAHDLSAPNDGPSSFGGGAGVPAPSPSAPPQAPAPAGVAPPPKTRSRGETSAPTAPADATAFAPKKLRRGTPEFIQISIHQPKDLKAVVKSAKKLDPRSEPAPQSMGVGDISIGATVAVSLDARGGACSGELQRHGWTGDPLNFVFSFEADDTTKQAIFFARVFVNDAQIGAIAFQRPISGPAKKPASAADGARLKRHKRVFLSYSSHDRETVSAIATAYEAAGVPHFWDRASLKSGEIWSPRLRREIDRSDLFHLCWSRSAAGSEWVEKETEHALERNKRSKGKNPDITVQMLDGPPWAPHPPQLDAINFDDFVRAAIVGYARGDGST